MATLPKPIKRPAPEPSVVSVPPPVSLLHSRRFQWLALVVVALALATGGMLWRAGD